MPSKEGNTTQKRKKGNQTRTGRRRSKGEGTVYYDRANDVWVAQISWGKNSEGRRRRKRATGATRAEALHQLAILKATLATSSTANEITTGAWLEAWLTDFAPARRSPNTLRLCQWAFQNWLIPHIGDIPLQHLTPADVEQVWKLMAANGLSIRTIIAARSTISAAITAAQRRGLVERHVVKLSELPHNVPLRSTRRAINKRKIQSLTQEEVDRLLETARKLEHPYEAMIMIGVTRGLRPGELRGLIWDDIDFENSTIWVRHALIEEGKRIYRGKLKTKYSERPLKMPAEVMEALTRRRAQWEIERKNAGKNWKNLNLVFCTRTGGYIQGSTFLYHLTKLGKQAGIENITPYLLRHTAASLLAEQGIPREGLAELLGHVNTQMVDHYYVHRIVPVIDVERWRPVNR